MTTTRPVLVPVCALVFSLSAAASARAQAGALLAAPAPMSLTASDGAGLELVSLSAEAAIEDPLAFTELHLIFRNPENRVREGQFRITLPSGATVSRFAMRIGDRWQEGEVVEQQAARVAYEDFLHRRQDPALLETAAGNEFAARIFPIPAAATKEIIISYAQELTRAGEPYRLPLRGLPRVAMLAVHTLSGGQETRFERRDIIPDRDFELAHAPAGGRLGLRDDNLAVARVVPLADTTAREEIAALHVLVDTSASRALGLADEAARGERLLARLSGEGDPKVTVAAFDQELVPLYAGKASGAAGVLGKRIRARGALGASDLERALAGLAGSLKSDKARRSRVLLVTDGVATAGEIGADRLRARVAALAGLGVRRLDVMAVGGIRDDVLLSRLVTAGLPQDGVILDDDSPAEAQLHRLTHATRSGITIAVDGAGWVWPNVVNGVQPGDEVLVYADLPPAQPFRLRIGGRPVVLAGTMAPAPRPLLERAWVKASIAQTLEQRDAVAAKDGAQAEALRQQAIALSVRNRVLCPFTSLLVLETEQDYARFGIERRALADILTVGPQGIALLHRTEIAAPGAEPRGGAAEEESLPPGAQPLGQDKASRSEPMAKKEMAREVPAMSNAPAARDEGRGRFADDRLDAAEASVASAPVAAAPPPAPAPARPPAADRARVGGGAGGPMGGHVRPQVARAYAHGVASHPVIAAPELVSETPPVSGPFKEVLDLIHAGRARDALAQAVAWREREAGDVLALVALGECYEALGDAAAAARAYGSIIDLFPGRADLRRFAGERLERVHGGRALALAIDTYRKAVEQRPDHPAGHHLLGFALLKAGRPRAAFEALAVGVAQKYPDGRFAGVDRILREDLGLAAAAWTHAEPARADEIRGRLARAGGTPETAASIRFILNWETDANDVDFHIHDGRGGHAFYSAKHLPSGGDLYADVTTGYGPECFTIRTPAASRAFPYRLQAHYYSRGPMGYGMGKLQIIDHDGNGNLRFDERPFVIMQDGAFVDLGRVGPRGVATAVAALHAAAPRSRVWAAAPSGASR
jgi:tetratricopeptide (TPR) repeat protein